jgi:hypothetical protein
VRRSKSGPLVPFALVIRYGVVAREEAYLERKFGDVYRRYRARAAWAVVLPTSVMGVFWSVLAVESAGCRRGA